MMIQGYAKDGPFEDALNCFGQMKFAGIGVNKFTLSFMLKACGEAKEIKFGKVVHGLVVKSGFASNLFVGNPLMSFYGKCKEVSLSRKVFEEMVEKDIVSWNSIISAYVINGFPHEALELFRVMLNDESILPDRATLVGILPACAQLSTIKEGLWIHSWIVKSCMEIDAALGSGLISFYANIGRLMSAKLIFDQVSDKNIVVWNAMIRAYGTHGHADIALNHAIETVRTMPIEAREDAYGALLGACRIHKNIELAEEVAEKLFDLDPKNSGQYLILIKMYEDAAKLRTMMRDKKIQRQVGYSAVEVDYTLHKFGAEEEAHPFAAQIFYTLHKLELVMGDEQVVSQIEVNL